MIRLLKGLGFLVYLVVVIPAAAVWIGGLLDRWYLKRKRKGTP